MNIREDIRQLKTGARELRRFGLLVGGVFTALGVVLLVRDKGAFPYFLIPGFALVVLGLSYPRALKSIYVAWMALAFVLGVAVSTVILTLLFFLVVTPIGIIGRVSGKDFLRLRLDRRAKSYWIARESGKPKSPADYERQY